MKLPIAILALSLVAAAPDADKKTMSPEESQAKVRETLNKSGPAVDVCTIRYVEENPKTEGSAELEVAVAEDGSVSSSNANTKLSGARNLRSCLEKVGKTWKFPAPNSPGQKFTLNIPVKANVKFRMLSDEEKKKLSPKEKVENKGFMTFLPNFTFRGPSQ